MDRRRRTTQIYTPTLQNSDHISNPQAHPFIQEVPISYHLNLGSYGVIIPRKYTPGSQIFAFSLILRFEICKIFIFSALAEHKGGIRAQI